MIEPINFTSSQLVHTIELMMEPGSAAVLESSDPTKPIFVLEPGAPEVKLSGISIKGGLEVLGGKLSLTGGTFTPHPIGSRRRHLSTTSATSADGLRVSGGTLIVDSVNFTGFENNR